MRRKAGPKKTKKTRTYDNTTRSQKSDNKRQAIIEIYVNMLVERKGAEISLEELAEKSKLSTRTLFRFFGDKKSLNIEIEKYLEQYLSTATTNLSLMNLEDYAAFTFELFDQHENLIQAYLYTNFGQTSRILFRKKFNALLIDKLKTNKNLKPKDEDYKKILLIISLINANIWSDIRSMYNFSGAEMSAAVKWTVKTLIQQINQ